MHADLAFLRGILTMEICLQRSLPLHVQVGPCQLRDGQVAVLKLDAATLLTTAR